MKRREKTYESGRLKIIAHFKKQRRKATLAWIIFEVAAICADFFLTKAIFDKGYLQWFLIALFFVVVFPTTLLSKKLKSLSKTEREQLKLLETDF